MLVVLQAELAAKGDKLAVVPCPLPISGPQGALGTCLERSRQLCLSLYEKELFTETSYLDLYQRLATPLPPQQLAVFAGEALSAYCTPAHVRQSKSEAMPGDMWRYQLDTS